MTATDLRIRLDDDEQVHGGLLAGVNPIGGYLDLELTTTNHVTNVQISGNLRRHGPQLMALLDEMALHLRYAMARDSLDCRERAREEDVAFTCRRLSQTVAARWSSSWTGIGAWRRGSCDDTRPVQNNAGPGCSRGPEGGETRDVCSVQGPDYHTETDAARGDLQADPG